MAKMPQSERVVTGEGRASYAFVFTPQANNKGVKQYRMTLLLPKSNVDEINRLKAIAKAVGVEAFGANFADQVRAGMLKWPFRDGDLTHPGDPVYAGHFYIGMRQSEDRPPQIIDANGTKLFSPTEFGSGDFCQVSGKFFAYNTEGNRGVSFSLGNILKTRAGERIDSTVDAKTDFDEYIKPGAGTTGGASSAASDFDL